MNGEDRRKNQHFKTYALFFCTPISGPLAEKGCQFFLHNAFRSDSPYFLMRYSTSEYPKAKRVSIFFTRVKKVLLSLLYADIDKVWILFRPLQCQYILHFWQKNYDVSEKFFAYFRTSKIFFSNIINDLHKIHLEICYVWHGLCIKNITEQQSFKKYLS